MNNINDLLHTDIGYVLVGIVLIGVVLKFIFELIDYFIAKTGIEFKWKREQSDTRKTLTDVESRLTELETRVTSEVNISTEHIRKIERDIGDISKMLSEMSGLYATIETINEREENTSKALIEIMYDKISERCHKYLEAGYIPEDEVVALNNMLDKYTLIGGNHGLENKVKYCIKKLPIHPSFYIDEEDG